MNIVSQSHIALLRELIVAGYQDAALLAAFERACRTVIEPLLAGAQSIAAKGKAVQGAVQVTDVDSKRTAKAPLVVVPPPENAKGIGKTALARSGLPRRAIVVGERLLDHFNLGTGRCDPGRGAIAQSTGLEPRTVTRAIADLAEAGLFGVVQHGGTGNTNRYVPNWPALQQLASGEGGQNCPADMDRTVHQTSLKNLDSTQRSGRHKAGRHALPDRRQGHLPLPITGGKAKAEAAQDNAQIRIWQAFQRHCEPFDLHIRKALYAAYSSLDSADAAVAAEERQRGSGLRVLLELIELAKGPAGLRRTGS